MLYSFMHAKLIKDANNPTEDEAIYLARRVVMEAIIHLPFGAKKRARALL